MLLKRYPGPYRLATLILLLVLMVSVAPVQPALAHAPLQAAADSYEPDNDYYWAKPISPGETQTHSIHLSADEDWMTFTLNSASSVVITVSGTSGTELWLWDGDHYQIASGTTLISRTCSNPLLWGDYYIMVRDYYRNNTIDSYTLSLSVTPCATPTPTSPPSSNIILDPGFEGSMTGGGWRLYSNIPTVDRDMVSTLLPHTGSYSARLCGEFGSPEWACIEYVEQVITVPNNGLLTYWWLMQSSNNRNGDYFDRLYVELYAPGSKGITRLRTRTLRDQREVWSQDSIDLSMLAGQTVILRFRAWTSKTIISDNASSSTAFYIDDVVVRSAGFVPPPTVSATPTKTPTPTATATRTPTNTPSPITNLMVNPGFETGSLSPWTAVDSVSVPAANARSGSYAVQVGGTSMGYAQQVISGLSPNTTYTLSGWAKVNASGVTASIGVKNYGGTQTGRTVSATTYTQVSLTFTTGPTNTTATIYCAKATSSGAIFCDDLVVRPAP